MIEEQGRFSEMQSKQMEEMMKKIEEMSRTQGEPWVEILPYVFF